MAESEYCRVILDGVYSEDELVLSAGNYAEYCKITGADKIYYASNFLAKVVFEDYLPGKYRAPEPRKKKNGFTDFPQRKYDFEQLEKDFLNVQADTKVSE